MLETAYKVGSSRAEQEFLDGLLASQELEKDASASGFLSAGRALFSGAAQGARAGGSSLISTARSSAPVFTQGARSFGQGAKSYFSALGSSRPVQAGKFMLGMGGKSRLGKAVSFWGASPLTFGGINAAFAEEGQRGDAFVKGVLGGLLFNAGMRGGEKLVGAGMRKAFTPKGGKGINAFTRHTSKSVKANAPKGLNSPKPQVGDYAVSFGQLGAADKARRAVAATGVVAGGFGGGMLLSSAADPMYDALRGNQVPYKAHPMTHVNNPYNPVYYR